MAYNKRFELKFKDIHSVNEWTVTIWKEGYTGSVDNVSGEGDDPVRLRWESGQEFFSPVGAGEAEINLLDETGGQFREMLDPDPFAFTLTVYRDDTLYFSGFNVPDVFTEEYTELPRPVTLRFIDGLGLLKHRDYKPIGDTPQRVSYEEAIFHALKEIEWQENSNIPLISNLAYFDTNTNTSGGSSALREHYINEEDFEDGTDTTFTSDGNRVEEVQRESYYKALEKIAKSFGARLSISSGIGGYALRILSVNAYTKKDATYFIKATSPGSALTALVFNVDPINLVKRPGNSGDLDPADCILRDNDQVFEFSLPRPEALVTYDPERTNEGNIFKRGYFNLEDFELVDTEFANPNSSKFGKHTIKDWTRKSNGTSQILFFPPPMESGAIIFDVQDPTQPQSDEYWETPFRFFRSSTLKIKIDLGLYVSQLSDPSDLSRLNDTRIPPSGAGKKMDPIKVKLRLTIRDNSGNDYYVYWNSSSVPNEWDLDTNPRDIFTDLFEEDDFKRELEIGVDPPTNDGFIKARFHRIENYQIQFGASLPTEFYTGLEITKLELFSSDETVFSRKVENGTVSNKALAEPVEFETPFSGNNPATDLSSISYLDSNNDHKPATEWTNAIDTYSDEPLRHAKLLARELVSFYSKIRRILKGSITHGNTNFNSLFTLEEFPGTGEIYSYLAFNYDHSLRLNKVEIEAFEGLYTEGITDSGPSVTDPGDVIPSIDFPKIREGPIIGGSRNGGNPSEPGTIPDGPPFSGGDITDPQDILRGGLKVADLCTLDGDDDGQATLVIPHYKNAADTIRLKALCNSCSNITLSIEDETGAAVATMQCGDEVTLIPSDTIDGYIVVTGV